MKPQAARALLIAGWLLTPIVAWAASFLGGWIGALLGGSAASPFGAVGVLALGSALGALVGAGAWVYLLRRWSLMLNRSPDQS